MYLDISRHYRECLPPKDYINFSYYEKWLAALTNLLIDKKLVSLDELKEYVSAAIHAAMLVVSLQKLKQKKFKMHRGVFTTTY